MTAAGEAVQPLTEISTLDAILGDHSAELGADGTPCRNHADRVANLCLAQSPSGADVAVGPFAARSA